MKESLADGNRRREKRVIDEIIQDKELVNAIDEEKSEERRAKNRRICLLLFFFFVIFWLWMGFLSLNITIESIRNWSKQKKWGSLILQKASCKKKRNNCRNIAYRLLKTTTTVQCHIGKIADTSMLYGTYRRGFSHELKKWYSFKFRSCFICFLGRIIFSLERIY